MRWTLRTIRRLHLSLVVVALAFSFNFGYVSHFNPPALAQSKPTEEIITDIQSQAERHAKLKKVASQTDLINAFGERGAEVGLSVADIEEIYENAYLEAQEPTSPWMAFKPQVGWAVAAFLFILLAFRDVLKDWIKKYAELSGDWLHRQLAGSNLLQTYTLRRYRQSLVRKHQKLKIPFRPNSPLDMSEIYIPLKVSGTKGFIGQIDAFKVLKEQKRFVVIGPPGSGKTILLRNIVFTYGRGGLDTLQEQPVPVLLELYRLRGPDFSQSKLVEEIVSAFSRYDFPNAKRFVQESLKKGKLMLLLDGLDEVSSGVRAQLVREIQEFLDINDKCRAIITCRTAVYNGEFDHGRQVDRTLEVVQFSDQQIRRFLKTWQSKIPPETNKSIDQLIQTLRERPSINELARNPLLLTIIAYLYTDTPFILPHSRAEFYQQSTDFLLGPWRGSFNAYKGNTKRQILQHLALYAQEGANLKQKDKRSLEYSDVLSEIKKVLPSLNLDTNDHAALILSEIVERSGLLLKIDGGDRYQFAHLTIQEYFAASAISNNDQKLIALWIVDPDLWRETAKLWCGVSNDSTTLIHTLSSQDTLTAFECLADAQFVESEVANQLILDFQERFGNDTREEVLRAFGTVAADVTQSRGRLVFNFLANTLKNSPDNERRSAAAKALSFTNRSYGAELLAQYIHDDDIGVHIIGMGNVAVSTLSEIACSGKHNRLQAVSYLISISTSESAERLVPLLWDADDLITTQAAYGLAQLIALPEIEETVREITIHSDKLETPWLTWVLDPFDEPTNSNFSIICGRIAYVISYVEAMPMKQHLSSKSLDPRITASCCGVALFNKITIDKSWTPSHDSVYLATSLREQENGIKLLPELHKRGNEKLSPMLANAVIEVYIGVISRKEEELNTVQRKLLNEIESDTNKIILSINGTGTNCSRLQFLLLRSSSLPLRLGLLACLLHRTSQEPTYRDWQQLFHRVSYDFQNSISYRVILAISALLSIVAITKMGSLAIKYPSELWSSTMVIGMYYVIIAWVSLAKGQPVFRFLLFDAIGPFGVQTFWDSSKILNLWRGVSYISSAIIGYSVYLSVVGAGLGALYWIITKDLIGLLILTIALSSLWVTSWTWSVYVAKTEAEENDPLWGLLKGVAQTRMNGLLVVFVCSSIGLFWLYALVSTKSINSVRSLVGLIGGISFLAGSGVGMGNWYGNSTIRAIYQNDSLAPLAFPFFCSAPIVLIFSGLWIHSFFQHKLHYSGLYGVCVEIAVIVFCFYLWSSGRKRDRRAQNPLQWQGLLEKELARYRKRI